MYLTKNENTSFPILTKPVKNNNETTKTQHHDFVVLIFQEVKKEKTEIERKKEPTTLVFS